MGEHWFFIDSSKAERLLGWRPRTTFEQGLERTVRWYRDNAAWLERVRDVFVRDLRSGEQSETALDDVAAVIRGQR